MWSTRNVLLLSILFSTITVAQQIVPSTNSTNVFPVATYPRYNVNASGSLRFPSFQIVPLAQWASVSRSLFVTFEFDGRIVETNSNNANQVRSRDISYVSCDPQDYNGPIGPAGLVSIISELNAVSNVVIFYTRTGTYCQVSQLPNGFLPQISYGVYTTLDPAIAGQIADMNFDHSTNALASVRPDLDTYTDPNAPFYNSTNSAIIYNSGSTTAVAMIVLYTITGIITALFISIIATGAIRAHLHPERYGPRAGSNARGGQSRAKGIARAVLETIPIVKFGDQHNKEAATKKEEEADVEMTSPISPNTLSTEIAKDPSVTVATAPMKSESPTSSSPTSPTTTTTKTSPSNADGTDDLGGLGCSICTEEFKRGEEVRVLPCNHKYHPDCVDPWLLNVSGTCPLCRVDLRGPSSSSNAATIAATHNNRDNDDDDTNTMVDPIMVIPATSATTNLQVLRSAFAGSRDERIAALRRFRTERRNNNHRVDGSSLGDSAGQQQQDEESHRRGLAGWLASRFRIRTRRYDFGVGSADGANAGGGGSSAVPRSLLA